MGEAAPRGWPPSLRSPGGRHHRWHHQSLRRVRGLQPEGTRRIECQARAALHLWRLPPEEQRPPAAAAASGGEQLPNARPSGHLPGGARGDGGYAAAHPPAAPPGVSASTSPFGGRGRPGPNGRGRSPGAHRGGTGLAPRRHVWPAEARHVPHLGSCTADGSGHLAAPPAALRSHGPLPGAACAGRCLPRCSVSPSEAEARSWGIPHPALAHQD
mmetsp:Transcript_37108/g.104737  ORF Transcript_37108/g.104737 Transcript_37108/m.104737 type:complete len:214 (+) Transcript_37108:494-1135(+)